MKRGDTVFFLKERVTEEDLPAYIVRMKVEGILYPGTTHELLSGRYMHPQSEVVIKAQVPSSKCASTHQAAQNVACVDYVDQIQRIKAKLTAIGASHLVRSGQ